MDELAVGFVELLDGEGVSGLEDELVLLECLKETIGGLED